MADVGIARSAPSRRASRRFRDRNIVSPRIGIVDASTHAILRVIRCQRWDGVLLLLLIGGDRDRGDIEARDGVRGGDLSVDLGPIDNGSMLDCTGRTAVPLTAIGGMTRVIGQGDE